MSDDFSEMLEVLRKMHALLELLAEDKVAERDEKQRKALLEIAGTSVPMQKSIHLMNGARTQKEIRTATGAHKGNLSTMIGKLQSAKLLEGTTKIPKLIITIPQNFFERHAQAK